MIEVTTDIQAIVDQIADAYRKELTNQGKVASGKLRSFTVEIVQDEKWFNIVFNIEHYWKYVENGRSPGKFPPIDAILSWIRIKPVVPHPIRNRVPTTKQLAFLIARSIAQKGIQPTHALQNTLASPQVDNLIEQLCNYIINEIEKQIDQDI
jgi:hypothetical protein